MKMRARVSGTACRGKHLAQQGAATAGGGADHVRTGRCLGQNQRAFSLSIPLSRPAPHAHRLGPTIRRARPLRANGHQTLCPRTTLRVRLSRPIGSARARCYPAATRRSTTVGLTLIALLLAACARPLTEAERARSYNSPEALRTHPRLEKFARWVAKRPPEFLRRVPGGKRKR